jgi:hypothetical protein
MKEYSLRGISRIHSKGAGWLVRLYRNGKVISKLFSDGMFGGSDKSLQAAKEYYRQVQKDFPLEQKPPFREKPLRNNKSGFNGICETYSRTKKGEKIPCWNVSWYSPPNKLRSKKFYFHDEQERRQTLKEALKFRKDREVEILRRAQKGKKAKSGPPLKPARVK